MGDRHIFRPVPTQDNIKQKNADLNPCRQRDSNPRTEIPQTSCTTRTGGPVHIWIINKMEICRGCCVWRYEF